jgi:hypothetical protein
MTAVIHGDLSGEATNLDAALYQASVLCHASADLEAVVFYRSAGSREEYRIVRGDSQESFDLAPQGWRLIYTLRGERQADRGRA